MQFLQLVAAVLAANFFTVMFLWGLWKARNTLASGEGLTVPVFATIVLPLVFMGDRVWFYWTP